MELSNNFCGIGMNKITRIVVALFVIVFTGVVLISSPILLAGSLNLPTNVTGSTMQDLAANQAFTGQGLGHMPAGFLGVSRLIEIGNGVVPKIMQTTQFNTLAKGIAYHTNQYSFGYEWGPNISTEIIMLYSPNNSTTIQTYVDTYTGKIESMSITNASDPFANSSMKMGGTFGFGSFQGSNISRNTANQGFTTANSSSNFGGYSSQYCTNSLLGYCYGGASILSQVYGNIQIPGTLTKPNGATASCCQIAEWTGLSSGILGQLIQGGVAWSGFNMPKFKYALSNGFVLFTQYTGISNITFITPPSWMNGIQGQTIKMSTAPSANCVGGGDLWYETWQVGSYGISIPIAGSCSSPLPNYGWYIFEAPTFCNNLGGNYGGACQLPSFSTVAFTGNICNSTGSCRNINSNGDPIPYQYYIQHYSIDTATSSIPSGGNSWSESWLSSN